MSRAGRTACPQAALTCGAVLPQRRFSLHARSAHGRRTGNGCVKEGETAGVKATFWPEVKSRGAWLMAISESKGLLYVLWLHVTAATQIYPLKNGSKWIFFKKRKKKKTPQSLRSFNLENQVTRTSIRWATGNNLLVGSGSQEGLAPLDWPGLGAENPRLSRH